MSVLSVPSVLSALSVITIKEHPLLDDIRARLEKALAGTYRFERELGGGGMSRTYLAVEEALGRRVVIKVLAPELLAGLSVERFRREVLLAAQLQHPHIVPVHSAGDMDGVPWFTMPYVDGESLRRRLEEGPLAIGEAISILRDVARALAYAHRHGVVHRDIKPDNVLLSSGTATVTDFGIAKAISAARAEGADLGATLTQVGTSIGTPTYMAPEQAVGDANTDHRADLYAFGVMAYELLTGAPPFQADTPARLVAAHLGEVPRDLGSLREDCPAPLADLVMRCLAKDPGDRPSHAGDLLRVLDTITSSTSTLTAPAILRGGQVRLERALALWGAATAGMALTAWAATEVIGLPDWVLPGALLVMLAGLPIILATAYVQRQVRRSYTATPNRSTGAAAGAHGTMATLALRASPHLSWRRTWLGGTVAVGAFAALVLGFMVMRAFGIGPLGSLQGKGVLGSREVLVVADFRGPDADPSLGPTVAEALRTDLGQSAAFTVLTRATLREILGLMERSAETVVAYDVAREIATREGAKAVLDGEVVRLGQGYVISARLVAALDGAELATFRQEASNDDALLPALGRLSRAVRERTGESLRSIRASTELERVTTPSLAALRRYVEGTRLADEEGESDRGLAMLQEAVELDTGFAMAWRKLATILSNEGRDRDRATRALETAYRHRDRLTEMERLITEGSYYYRGPAPDLDRALAVYTEMYRLDSTSTHALNNAAVIYGERRDDLRAEEMYRRVIALPRVFSGAYSNLVITQVVNGRPPEVIDSTIEAFRTRFPGNNDIWEAEWYGAYGAGDLERADSLSRAAFQQGRTFRQQSRGAGVTSQVALLRGRPLEGLQWATRGSEIQARVTPSRAAPLNFALDSVEYAVFGQRDLQAARMIAERGMRRLPADAGPQDGIGWTRVAHLAALIGDPALARQALAGFERDEASLSPQPAARRAFYEGLVAMAGEEWDLAIGKLHQADAGFQIDERQAYAYLARAHDLAGRPDSARAYLERYVSTPDFLAVRDARWLPSALRRLGELYEESGEIDRAIEHYARFVNLWRNAEPELQPQVREVNQRLERLRAGRG